jgi:hypothetical protein
MSSPTQHSLDYYRKRGFDVQVVEYWISHGCAACKCDRCVSRMRSGPGKRRDLFGVIDIVAQSQDRLIGVQSTSAENIGHRIAKAILEPRLMRWLRHADFEVHGWRIHIKNGVRRWEVDIRTARLETGKIVFERPVAKQERLRFSKQTPSLDSLKPILDKVKNKT